VTVLQLWPTTNGPTSWASASAGATVATEFQVTSGTWWLTELRVWRGTYDVTGPIYTRVYLVNSPSSGTAVVGTDLTIIPRGLGWQTRALPVPVLLTAGQVYRACYWTPNGASSTSNYW
jgi:Domain of unknown function (DUF4082)